MSEAAAGGRTIRDNSSAWSQRTFNRFVRWMLGSPLHPMMSGRLMIIEVTGRRTGARYAIPTAYAERDGQVLAASAGTWARNLSSDRPAVLVHRGRRRAAVPEVAADAERVREIAADLLPGNPILQGNMSVQLGPDGHPDPEQLAAARDRGWRFFAFSPAG